MLPAQQRGRRHNGHLPAGHDGGECTAQGDLGLTKAHIAADQAVHGGALLQVAKYVVDGAQLILSLLERERGAEFLVQTIRAFNGGGGAQDTFGGHLDQLISHVTDVLLQLRLACLPGGPTQAVQDGSSIFRTIARQQFDILRRQEQLVIAVIVYFQAIMGRTADLDGLQAKKTPDPMLYMHHQITVGKLVLLGQKIFRLAAAPPRQTVPQHVLFRDNRQPVGLDAILQAQHHHGWGTGGQGHDGGPVIDGLYPFYAMVIQQQSHALGRALAHGGKDHASAQLALFVHMAT